MKATLATLSLLLAFSASAAEYVVISDATATTHVLTVQQPASNARRVRGIRTTVQCGAAGEVVVERNGSAASATEATITGAEDRAPTPRFVAFTASNVGTGVVLDRQRFTTDQLLTIETKSYVLSQDGGGKNLTFRVTPSGSTRCIVVAKVDEY